MAADRFDIIVELMRERLCDIDADDFEVYLESVNELEIEAGKGKVESSIHSMRSGAALRVFAAGRVGMASTTDLALPSVERLIADAVAVVKQSDARAQAACPVPSAQPGVLAERPGRPFGTIDIEDKVDVACTLEAAALSADPRVTRVRKPVYREIGRRAAVVNSRGIDERATRTIAFVSVQAIAEEGGLSESAGEIVHGIRFEDLDPKAVGWRAGARAASLLGARSVPTGRYPVCLEPRAAAALLGMLMPSFFAENVERHKSRLAGALGAQRFSPSVTIVDDGLLTGGAGSFLVDDEGVARRRTVLVERGVVKGFLYDGASALREDTASTGNAARPTLQLPPQTAVTNAFIEAGTQSLSHIMGACEGGLWIADLMGLHTADVITGDFSLGAIGFRITGGLRCEPVRGIMIAGNVHDLLSRVEAVGDDIEFFGRYGSPTIAVGDVQINGGR